MTSRALRAFAAILAALLSPAALADDLGAEVVPRQVLVSSSGDPGATVRDLYKCMVEAQPVPPGMLSLSKAKALFLQLAGGTATGQINAPSFGVTSVSGIFGPNGTGSWTGIYGFGFEPGSQSLLFRNNSTEQWRISGASGDFTSSQARNVTTAGVASFDHYVATSTTQPQFQCTGAGSCLFYSTSGNNVGLDEGAAGTALVGVGTTFATQVQIGRLGQTTTIRGNATFGTAGPNLGSTVTGTWSPFASGLLVAATNYGAFNASQSVTNVALRQVTCSHGTAGVGTAGTLAIRNVTDSTTLCSGSYTCTTAANTPTTIFDCNAAPVAGKNYAIQFSTGCGTTQVTNLACAIEIAH